MNSMFKLTKWLLLEEASQDAVLTVGCWLFCIKRKGHCDEAVVEKLRIEEIVNRFVLMIRD